MKEIGIMEVGGFRIGHAQNEEAATGCTVLLLDEASPAGVDIRGGGPASRESQLMNPLMMIQSIHAILLSGGSAFGLDAAGGVQKYLEERNIGYDVGVAKVPLVPQSCLFDLAIGRPDVRPDAAMAYAACEHASYEAPAEGNVGAGCGCTIGKFAGPARCMKSGFGTFAVQAGDVKVGAMVAVNALGDVTEDGQVIAGLLNEEGTGLARTQTAMMEMLDALAAAGAPVPQGRGGADGGVFARAHENTTLGIIVTNAAFEKNYLCKIAGMAHNGYARAICPVHTMADGDSIYAVSTGSVQADVSIVGIMAAYAMERAIQNAARKAEGAYGLKGFADLNR